MKQLVTILTAAFVTATIAFVPVHATGYVNQADIDAIDSANNAYAAFADETDNNNATIESMAAKATAAANAFETLAQRSYSTGLGTSYTNEATTLKTESGKLRDKLQQFNTVTATKDETAINNYFTELDQQVKSFDNQVEKLNSAVDESNNSTSNWFLWVLIATVVVSAAAFVWAFLLEKKPSSPELTKARRQVAYMSLAPILGAAITFLTFMFASQTGGGYTIMYGLVVLGAIALIQAIARYAKLAKMAKARQA